MTAAKKAQVRVLRALEELLEEIEEAQHELEQAQARLEGLLPLRVVWKRKSCGKAHCRCAQGMLHGPYPYLIEHKEGRKLEHYLGKRWSPPEGMVPPGRYRALMEGFQMRRERLERLLDRLERAVAVLEGYRG